MSAEVTAESTPIAAIRCPHCGESLSEAEVRSILGQFGRSERFGRVRGNRFAKLTPEQRSAEARKAGLAYWAKKRAASAESS